MKSAQRPASINPTLFILLALSSMNGYARSRMADAEVTSVNGVPCFSISKQEERRNGQPFLGALSVSDVTVKPTTEIWGFLMTDDKKIPLSSTNCIPYGNIPAHADAAPAPELKTGRVYEVFLNGRPADPADPTYGYVAKFCLIQQVSAKPRLVVIKSDTQAWMDDTFPARNSSR
ncbi:hypothetical protein D9M09_23580 [Janthinobacterium agaricidamnosum]|uniref:Uncharacterized protein n=1 Tax=Janthinobacterium agaricidamnosum TaxID=55508 RepID=A0A3G2EHE9_9BURK|nr:hypothetical protein [Janthinobacterium agaricidamnosum]AYM78445.1 hypothetical protein D9M09_23580 [Janthinobacterium agaricidamnosum]